MWSYWTHPPPPPPPPAFSCARSWIGQCAQINVSLLLSVWGRFTSTTRVRCAHGNDVWTVACVFQKGFGSEINYLDHKKWCRFAAECDYALGVPKNGCNYDEKQRTLFKCAIWSLLATETQQPRLCLESCQPNMVVYFLTTRNYSLQTAASRRCHRCNGYTNTTMTSCIGEFAWSQPTLVNN